MAKPDDPSIDDALKALERGAFWLGRSGKGFSPAFVRAFVAAESRNARHVLLELAVPADLPDDELMTRWRRAVEALRGLDLTHAWGAKPRRERFRALAADPVMLAAIQGAAALGENVPIDMLAVLVADGSDASIDALIPHLGNALDKRDSRLDRLRRLRTHAADTPRMRALLAELDDTYDARNASSPALALGPIIGIGGVSLLWFDARIWSREVYAGHTARVQGTISVDSRRTDWFRVYVSEYGVQGSTRFGSHVAAEDHHGVGACDAADLPAWLAATAKHLRVTWDDYFLSSNLRGTKRERIAAWLDGR
ncbi:MAG TPA: hypothetical protein VGL61_21575 [Kofleriaceae bacterium]|jgi:hypothetical protein